MVFNRYAAGKKVYNGGSSAATRGTVDPQGYVERSLAQRASQRRSGLAKAATRRIDKNKPAAKKAAPHRTPPKNRPSRPNQQPNNPGQQPGGNNQQPNNPNQQPGQDKQPGGQQTAPGLNATPQYPSVQISPNGQLNLPWNMDTNLQSISAQQKLNEGLLGLQNQEQSYMSDFTRNERDANQSWDQAQGSMRGDFANRGLLQSTPYLQAQTEGTNRFNQYMGDLNTDKTNFMQNIAAKRLGLNNNFKDVMTALGIENVGNAADQAGDLGIGRSQVGAVTGDGGRKHPTKKQAAGKKHPGGKKHPAKKAAGKKHPNKNKLAWEREKHLHHKKRRLHNAEAGGRADGNKNARRRPVGKKAQPRHHKPHKAAFRNR